MSQWRLTVIQDEWCVIINVSVIGRPHIVGLNKPSAFKLPLSLTLTGLVGGDPVLSARVAINEILRQKLWFLKHLWDVNLIWLEVKWLICHLFEKPEPVILVVTAYILQFVDFGSSAGRWILTTASIRWIKHNVITWCHMGRAINLISFHFWSSRIYCI